MDCVSESFQELTKKIKMEIKKEYVVDAYMQGDNIVKEMLRAMFPDIDFEHESRAKNRPITERVKTFEDACRELGGKHPFVVAFDCYLDNVHDAHIQDADIIAYLKLRIICAALNEGCEPKFEKGECRYFHYFYIYTKEQYDELDDEGKGRCVLRSGNYTVANCGSRLAFRTRELAAYAGRQFTEEWTDFMFKPRTGEDLNGKSEAAKTTIDFNNNEDE